MHEYSFSRWISLSPIHFRWAKSPFFPVNLDRPCLYLSSVLISGLVLFQCHSCRHNAVCCCRFAPSSMHLIAVQPFIQRQQHQMKLNWHFQKVDLGLPGTAYLRQIGQDEVYLFGELSPQPHAHTHRHSHRKINTLAQCNSLPLLT